VSQGEAPRRVAFRVLRRITEGAYVNLTLDGESQRAQLSPPDRRLATALVYGVLKGRARLDHALAAHAPRGIDKLDDTMLDLLRLGALQLLELRVPAHAAVDATVGAVRKLRGPKLAGFANGLLRKLADAGAPAPPAGPPEARLSVLTGAPRWVVDAAVARLGLDEAGALLEAEGRSAPVWLRVNRLRGDRETVITRLRQGLPRAQVDAGPLDVAIRVQNADGVFESAPYAEGLVTAQDLGAQWVAELVGVQPGERVLDACAGVGGKSSYLAEAMQDRGVVLAADASARKLELGADHARRLGLHIVRSLTGDLTQPNLAGMEPLYDRVLLDAPCSGLGVARRHPEVRLKRRDAVTSSLTTLQGRLLDRVASRVRPGGVLVYAVCTYTDEEGPAQVKAFLSRHPEFERDAETPLPPSVRGRGEPGELRTWPHRDDADGFFAARMRRRLP
jgi:16S rRNA (cytosine967-C5)-methyltransferase